MSDPSLPSREAIRVTADEYRSLKDLDEAVVPNGSVVAVLTAYATNKPNRLMTVAEWRDTVSMLIDMNQVQKRIRQLVFDIVMQERNMDESDMDDQAEASGQVDEWMEHWAVLIGVGDG